MVKKLLITAGVLVLLVGGYFLVSAFSSKKEAEPAVANQKGETKAAVEKIVEIGFPGTNNFIDGIAGIAQEKGFINEQLKKIGYKAEFYPFAQLGPAVNEALVANKIDYAIYADLPGVVLKSKDAPTELLGILDSKIEASLVAGPKSTATSIKDLKGKKIGFAKGTYSQKFLFELLERNGISQKDVQLVNVVTDAESALVAGNIDAFATTKDGASLLAQKKEGTVIDSTSNYPGTSAQWIFVGRQEFSKENGDVPVALLKAFIQAKQYVVDNQEDSYKILSKTGLPAELVKTRYAANAPKFDNLSINVTQASIDQLSKTVDFLYDQQLISQKFDVSKWVNNSYPHYSSNT